MQLLNFVPFGLPQICKGQVRVTYVLCVVLHANGRIYVYIYIYMRRKLVFKNKMHSTVKVISPISLIMCTPTGLILYFKN